MPGFTCSGRPAPSSTRSPACAPVAAASVKDAIALNPSFNNTWEVGYKGIIKDRVRLSVDLWYQLRGDVGAPIGQLNPLVFYDPATLGAFLQSRLAAPLAAFAGVTGAFAFLLYTDTAGGVPWYFSDFVLRPETSLLTAAMKLASEPASVMPSSRIWPFFTSL